MARSTRTEGRRTAPQAAGRTLRLVLRGSVLLLILLLLLDPTIPGTAPDAGERVERRWVLLDWGAALAVEPGPEGEFRELALEHVRSRASRGFRSALLGPEPEGLPPQDIEQELLRLPVGDPGPALRRLAESGADSIVFVSPLRFGAAILEGALDGLPIPVTFERVGGQIRNAGILELRLPRRVPAGELVEGYLTLFGEGGVEGDSLEIELLLDERELLRIAAPLPHAGTRLQLPLAFTAPSDTGSVRVTARTLLDGDRHPADDERVARLRVGPPEGGVVLVSLTPDWEPRVLLPVLKAATGLEGEGWLRLGPPPGRWLPTGGGADLLTPLQPELLRERVDRSGLLVVHGIDAEAPPWLEESLRVHPRVLHLPLGPLGDRLAGLETGGTRGGEWLPVPELPPSPVAPFLTGLELGGLPPLADLRDPPAGAVSPVLLLRRTAAEEPRPALVLRETSEGRRAIALAAGFWRWGHRSGEARELYRGLWSGVAGWLIEIDAPSGGELRPVRFVTALDDPQRWEAARGAGGRLVLEFRSFDAPVDEAEPLRRTVSLDERGRGAITPLPAGRWRWEGRVELPADTLRGTGEFEVEGWSGALTVPPLEPVPGPHRPVERLAGAPGAPGGRPLRTHPLPWLLLIALLCTGWILRRWAGLR